jgi:hypothetical protein
MSRIGPDCENIRIYIISYGLTSPEVILLIRERLIGED